MPRPVTGDLGPLSTVAAAAKQSQQGPISGSLSPSGKRAVTTFFVFVVQESLGCQCWPESSLVSHWSSSWGRIRSQTPPRELGKKKGLGMLARGTWYPVLLVLFHSRGPSRFFFFVSSLLLHHPQSTFQARQRSRPIAQNSHSESPQLETSSSHNAFGRR